ncbi:MAG TPA: DNA mismatch repair protein MutS, partial [Isosphaeraceae bacterium]
MQATELPTPRAEFLRRLEDRRGTAERQERRVRALADARLAVFAAGLVVAVLVLWARRLAPGWLTLPVALFVALVVLFERATRSCRHAARAAAFYEAGLARLEDRWAGRGEPGLRFRNPEHPYAEDLDLFGTGSLFERLCTARTRAGEDVLASWLLAPAAPEEVRARHEAVAELRPRLDLREDLALLGADVRAGVAPKALAAWGQAPPLVRSLRPLRIAATVLALLGVGTLVGWGLGWTNRDPFLVVLVLEILFALSLRGRVRGVLATVDER